MVIILPTIILNTDNFYETYFNDISQRFYQGKTKINGLSNKLKKEMSITYLLQPEIINRRIQKFANNQKFKVLFIPPPIGALKY